MTLCGEVGKIQMAMIMIKHLEINQILTLYNP